MITAVDTSQRVLVMTFRATVGNTQLGEEMLNYFVAKKKFFDIGYIFEFFYDAYVSLWRGGLETEIRNLKYKYPDYELW
uniref:Lipase_3 domain-containing protein n=1 Tax=Caenorhabditis japonica TaxID=281687 RepID=A0A8R1IMD1_CAEJA